MFLKVRSLSFHVRVDGPADAPVLLLLHSLGTNLHVWDWQGGLLATPFRIVRADLRGHGKSDVPAGPHSVEKMAEDIVPLLGAMGIETFYLAGLSLGGFIAPPSAPPFPSRV